MRALLVDPYQRKVHQIQVGNHIKDWYKWCDCDCFDHAYIGTHQGKRHDIFVDDSGLLHEPVAPCFVWRDYANPLVGYGLIVACDEGGNSIETQMPVVYAHDHIDWELWEPRLGPENYFDQLSRIYL